MHIRKNRTWELPNRALTPETHYLQRREFLRTLGLGVAATALFPATIRAASGGFPDSLNPAFKLEGVKLTPFDSVTGYNNFYEWGLAKEDPSKLANQGWKTEPWTIAIGGLWIAYFLWRLSLRPLLAIRATGIEEILHGKE